MRTEDADPALAADIRFSVFGGRFTAAVLVEFLRRLLRSTTWSGDRS